MTPRGRDPGLQPERTRLAWRRTTLSFTVTVLLAARTVAHGRGGGPTALLAAVCVLPWVGFVLVAQRRMRGLAAGARPGVLPGSLALGAVCCAVALLACAVAVVV